MQRVRHANRGRLLLRTPGPVPYGICKCSFVETTDAQSYTSLWHLSLTWLLPNLTLLLNIGFHRASATGVACRQGTLTPPDTWSCPHFGTCMCSNVETNLSWTCLVSGPLNFERPSVLLFCLIHALSRLLIDSSVKLSRLPNG